MPLNERKILDIILNQCNQVPERYTGYRRELLETISEIVLLERQHKVIGTNIQVKINDKVNAAGQLLARKRGQSSEAGGK